jgi:cell wall assembly regulator SMI1
VTEDDVRRFEREFGHELPDDYRAFLLEVNGGYASSSHCVFTLRRHARQDESVLNSLFSLNARDDQDDLAMAQKHYNPDAALPEGLLEIGYDGMGGRIVLPLLGPHRGEVWYFDTEDPRPTGSNPRVEWFDRRDVWKIANSFAEFMASLKPLDAAS